MNNQEIIGRLQNTIDGKKALAKDILRHIQLETNPQSLFLLNAQLQFLEANIQELLSIQADLDEPDQQPVPSVEELPPPPVIVLLDTATEAVMVELPVVETPKVEEDIPIVAPAPTKRSRKTK